MWLINCESLELEPVLEPAPAYAILSHTWGSDEVSFQDFRDRSKRGQMAGPGFSKIKSTCELALDNGIRFAWADTCCIDKSSSAELSEAINSMFIWYKRAKVCYAFLADVPSDVDVHSSESAFARCKWFTRGWTLQELITPAELEFYSTDWKKIGTKSDLMKELEQITGIDQAALAGDDLGLFSVAKRMSWAARRHTTRPEDIAYCLMGIFDVNMPMLYGEGTKAFIRLQEEILKQCEDQSLFAWKATAESAAEAPYRGLFASSPAEFAGCHDIVPFPSVSAFPIPVAVTNRGIPLTSGVRPEGQELGMKIVFVGLNCQIAGSWASFIMLKLICVGGDQYLRASPDTWFPREANESNTVPATATVYVAKSAHKSVVELVPQLELQNAFYLAALPVGVKFTTIIEGEVVPRIGSEAKPLLPRMIPPEAWSKNKAVIILQTPFFAEKVLVVLWTMPVAAGQSIQPFFDVMLRKNHPSPQDISDMEKPANAAMLHMDRVVSGPGQEEHCLVVRLEPQKHRGFDVFCINITARRLRGTTSFRRGQRRASSNERPTRDSVDRPRPRDLIRVRDIAGPELRSRQLERSAVKPGSEDRIDGLLQKIMDRCAEAAVTKHFERRPGKVPVIVDDARAYHARGRLRRYSDSESDERDYRIRVHSPTRRQVEFADEDARLRNRHNTLRVREQTDWGRSRISSDEDERDRLVRRRSISPGQRRRRGDDGGLILATARDRPVVHIERERDRVRDLYGESDRHRGSLARNKEVTRMEMEGIVDDRVLAVLENRLEQLLGRVSMADPSKRAVLLVQDDETKRPNRRGLDRRDQRVTFNVANDDWI